MTFRQLSTFFCVLQAVLTLATAHAQTPPPSTFLSPSLTSFDESSTTLQDDKPKTKKEASKTEITCEKEATFDNKTNIAEFFGRVTVKDPQFNLFCDHLIITLRKDRKGMQHTDAIGNVVITQENVNSDGQVVRSIGRSARANYDPATGNIILSGWPQLQQGINNHIATDKNTRMTLNRDGRSNTIGQSKTVIVDTQKNTPPQ